MILSNLCSFHAMQILQNATALPAYIYRETNNKARANRRRHELSKQHWLKKNALKQKQQPQKNENHIPKQETHQQNEAPHDSQDFIPPPFPEKRAPVTIDSQVMTKLNAPLQTPPTKPTRKKPTKLKHPTPKDGVITNKWLEAKPKQKSRKHHTNYTPLKKTSAKPQGKTRDINPPISTISQPTKFVWKPGRGAVEKIDKYSGEILHLVESA